jgi:predicted nucleotidyltransferase
MPTPAQQALIDAARGVLEADLRAESLWLSGSLANGEGDTWSDVDFVVVVAKETLPACVADYGRDVSAIAPAVHSQTLFGRVIHVVTEAWDRFDLLFTTPEEFAARDPAGVSLIFARQGAAQPKGVSPPPAALSDEQLTAQIREFIRILGLSAVVLNRGHEVLAPDGMQILRNIAVDLMLAENGRTRAGMSPKALARIMTDEQMAALAALPPLSATRASLTATLETYAALVLPRARKLAAARGIAWPQAFEDATRAWLRKTLDVSI